MQNLFFEQAWERTISDYDRHKIKQAFIHTKSKDKSFSIIPLWRAVNHEGDLLITTIIHNQTDIEFTINQNKIRYSENDQTIAEHEFSKIMVSSHTSMPWTLIFPKESIQLKREFSKAREDISSGKIHILE